jgi:signal transduction histidine kinase
MGRLFWKFFLIFWLAQVATVVGLGVAIWLFQPLAHPAGAGAMSTISSGATENTFSGTPWPPQHNGRPDPPPPILPILGGSVVSLLFAALLAWYFARPIRTLREAFESAAGGNLDIRAGAAMGRRRDELADLGHDFDRMTARLQTLIETQHRLLHDVSHELRSPLARLQAAVDLIGQQPERSAELLQRIARESSRMDRLIGELLTLARLDTGLIGEAAEEVDLRELLTTIADDARFEAQSKQCTIVVDVAGKPVTRGRRESLHRVIENVVRNATQHSPFGQEIGISVVTFGQMHRIGIADRGQGVPEDALESIFEPFFRLPSSRATGGYGLGLAIARRLTEAHAGHIRAKNRPGGGLLVILDLPMP